MTTIPSERQTDAVNEHFVSNRDESVRMFRQNWLERLSHVHPVVPHVLYIPLIVALLWWAPTNAGTSALLVVTGLLLWTLVEYFLHRHAFHAPDDVMQETHDIVARLGPGEPVIPALPRLRHVVYFIMHGVHHEYPNDSSRLVMPPGASIPLAVLFYGLSRLLFGPRLSPALFAGFVIGYLIYDTVHYAVHHKSIPTAFGRYTKWRHNRHHFLDPDRDYGVSSPLWDLFLGTLSRRTP
jgi:4-hydroxysphinganine ceramide fatty acyl 2-hydroxylase